MDCPRCGATDVSSPECPRCRVILSKALPPGATRAPVRRRSPPSSSGRGLALLGLGLALAVAAVVGWQRRPPAEPAPLPPPPVSTTADEEAPAGLVEDPPLPPRPDPSSRPWPDEPFDPPVLAGSAAPGTPAPGPPEPRALLARALESGDWAAAERAAREALALAPSDSDAVRGLAYAQVRQDRSREAIEALATFLDAYPDPKTLALLERIRRDHGSEAGLDEARVAHFHVRYDGEEHLDVGREVVRVLDRHHATLARAFDHQPAAPIPVVLLSRESYADATGAPAWSGGQFDSFDGRVRVPIGGLTAEAVAELDETLLHELTHAFVADISRGAAPREIHEGLAQLMEGKRSERVLGDEGLRALADGRLQGVTGFYLSSLSFVEYLFAQRGQGGVNDLLRGLAAGSGDPFRAVYGKSLEALQLEWRQDLRRRHGS